MLALDFDGVIADALLEGAAVTWFARDGVPSLHPPISEAVTQIPADFVAVFAQVRAYSRTLDDFMLAHLLYPASGPIDRQRFAEVKAEADPKTIAERVAAAEKVRASWRENGFPEWVAQHTVHAQMAELIRQTDDEIIIVSAKDAASIAAILAHHGLLQHIVHIEGDCHDKRAVLGARLKDGVGRNELIFVDDSIANILAVADLPLRALWADWGYHGHEDMALAREKGLVPLGLDDLRLFIKKHKQAASA